MYFWVYFLGKNSLFTLILLTPNILTEKNSRNCYNGKSGIPP